MSFRDVRHRINQKKLRDRMRREERRRARQENQPLMKVFRVICAIMGGHFIVRNIYSNTLICARCRQPLDKYGRVIR